MKTSYYLLFLLLFSIFGSCSSPNRETQEVQQAVRTKGHYKIKGFGLEGNGKVVFLSDSTGAVLQRGSVENGEFVVEGKPTTKIAFLHFEGGVKTFVFLDTIDYDVRGWDNNPERLFVMSEKPEQQTYNLYQKTIANIDRQLLQYCIISNDAKGKKYKELQEQKAKIISEFVKTHSKEYIGAFELNAAKTLLKSQETISLYANLDSLQKNTPLGIAIATALKKEEKQHTPPIDKTVQQPEPTKKVEEKKPERFPAPPFSGLSPEGYLIDLTKIATQNKITMLDFWGTWCQPCRMQNPFWVRLYKKYHAKGFEIISIAEETAESRSSLESAIKEDAMNWHHVIDENYEIAELYGAYSLPHAILIDSEGKIIYHKATARDVQEYLQTHLGN